MKLIQEKIKEKQKEILQQQFPHQEEFDFFEDVSNHIKRKDNLITISMDNSTFFLAYARVLNPDTDFEILLSKISEFHSDLNRISSENAKSFDILSNILEEVVDPDKIQTAIDILKSSPSNKTISALKLNRLRKKHNLDQDVFYLLYLCHIFFEDLDHSISFLELAKQLNINEILDGFWIFLNHQMNLKTLIEFLDTNDVDEDFLKKDYLRKIKQDETLNINVPLSKITNHINMLIKEKDNFERQKHRSYINLELLNKQLIEKAKKPNIIIDKQFEKLLDTDEEIKHDILIFIIHHNAQAYHKLKEENHIHDNNSITQLEKLFFKYGFELGHLSTENKLLLLQNKTIDELEEILRIITSDELSFMNTSKPYFIDILLSSNPTILEEIISYIKNGIINYRFLENHIGILISDNKMTQQTVPLYYTFIKNIRLLLPHRINWEELSEEQLDILVSNPSILKENLSLLQNYNISLADSKNFVFLQHPQLIDFIDTYIELGLYDFIMKHTEVLSTDENILKRILLLQSIQAPIINQYNKVPSSILTGKNFYIADENLDDYLISHSDMYISSDKKEFLSDNTHHQISNYTLQSKEISDLEKNNKINDLLYQFDDILISRLKVLRFFESLNQQFEDTSDNLLTSIIYRSYLTCEEIEKIKKCLDIKTKQKHSGNNTTK